MKTPQLIFLLVTSLILNLNVNGQQEFECFTPASGSLKSTAPSNCVNSPTAYTNYIPGSNTPVKIVKFNIHVMQKSNGSRNFQSTNSDHIEYLESVETSMNSLLEGLSEPYWGGATNDTYIEDARVQFELQSIYFHQDDIAWYNNGSVCGSYCYSNYKTNEESELNIFLCHHYDTTKNSPTGGCGPSDHWAVMYNHYEDYLTNGDRMWLKSRGILHEIGHTFGLSHTHSPDQFSDTYSPEYYTANYPDGWCDPTTDYQCSNNVMGYNKSKTYLSPYQLGEIHRVFSGDYHTRFLTFCDYDSNNTTTINSSQTWDIGKVFGGDIRITSGNTLTVECMISLPPGGKIIVESGGTLVLDGAHLTNSCENGLWNGIEVYGINSADQTSSSQGKVIIKNNSLIEYSKEISAINGGIIQADDSKFLNTDRAAEFLWYSPTVYNSASYFDNCEFEINNDYYNYDQSLRPFITLNGIKGVEISNCSFTNISTTETYDDLGTAIHSVDASYTVDNCEIEDLYYGIDVRNTDATYDVSIINSTINGNSRGIFLSNVDDAIVTDNDFDVPGTGSGSQTYGIYLNHCSGYDIDDNVIDGINDDNSTYGIIVNESGTASNEIVQCTMNDLYYGTIAQGANANSSVGLEYFCNTFEDNYIGMGIGQYDSTKTSHNIASEQGYLDYAAMNQFITNSYTDIYNTSTTFRYWYINSTYYNPSTTYSSPAPTKSEAWFNTNNCSAYGKKSTSDSFAPSDLLSDLSSLESDIKLLEADLSLHQKDSVEFYKSQPYTEIGRQLQELRFKKKLKSRIINSLLRIYKAESNADNKIIELLSLQKDQEYKYRLIDYLLKTERYIEVHDLYDDIVENRSSISEMEYYKDYSKILDMKTNILSSERTYFELTDHEKEELKKLAESNTKAGIVAKNILFLSDSICYEEYILDLPIPSKERKEEKSSNSYSDPSNSLESVLDLVRFDISPNPTNGDFEVHYDISSIKYEIAYLKVFDMSGRELFNIQLVESHDHISVNNQDLLKGTYLCIIRADNRLIGNKKIVVNE